MEIATRSNQTMRALNLRALASTLRKLTLPTVKDRRAWKSLVPISAVATHLPGLRDAEKAVLIECYTEWCHGAKECSRHYVGHEPQFMREGQHLATPARDVTDPTQAGSCN